MVVVADASPLHYLVLIEAADLLARLFGTIHVPHVARRELTHVAAPPAVRAWANHPPPWVTWHEVDVVEHTGLGPGESEALALATTLAAHLALVDDRAARRTVSRRGFEVVGTLGLLADAAELGHVDLRDAVTRLRQTTFRVDEALVQQLLAAIPPA